MIPQHCYSQPQFRGKSLLSGYARIEVRSQSIRALRLSPKKAVRACSSAVEQGTHNPLVGGSNPSGPTKLLFVRTIQERRSAFARLQLRSFAMIATLVLLALQAAAQTQPAPPTAGATIVLPSAVVRQRYGQFLRPPNVDLSFPWHRRVTSGSLPPGLQVSDSDIWGMPLREGEFRFELTTTDSSTPPKVVHETFVIVVENGITIRWTKLPSVDTDRIGGEVEVKNQTRVPVDLTVIIVAVNEIGKAFALGYQHFSFAPGAQTVPFGSTLPRGNYTIHADAIGEIAASKTIYRTRLQTSPPSVVP